MADGIHILLKRAKAFLGDEKIAGSQEKIRDYILEYGEPLHIKDLGILLIGDGVSTVDQLYAAHKFYFDANHVNAYGDAYYNKDIPANADKYIIANVGFVNGAISGSAQQSSDSDIPLQPVEDTGKVGSNDHRYARWNHQHPMPEVKFNSSDTIYVMGVTGTGNKQPYINSGVKIDCANNVLYGAAWNDFAEFRKCYGVPGTVVCETGDGDLLMSSERLQPGASVISDTYGMVIGEHEDGYQPIAVAGRVLALYGGEVSEFKPGMPVCAGPFGRIYAMTREEIKEYPEAIVGYVSEIPTYEEWNEIKIANRIWIKVK